MYGEPKARNDELYFNPRLDIVLVHADEDIVLWGRYEKSYHTFSAEYLLGCFLKISPLKIALPIDGSMKLATGQASRIAKNAMTLVENTKKWNVSLLSSVPTIRDVIFVHSVIHDKSFWMSTMDRAQSEKMPDAHLDLLMKNEKLILEAVARLRTSDLSFSRSKGAKALIEEADYSFISSFILDELRSASN